MVNNFDTEDSYVFNILKEKGVHKEGKIALKSIRPTQKAKYIVSIFHLLENELSELE